MDDEVFGDDDDASRRRKRGLLKMYYGTSQEAENKDPYDIDQAYFEHDAYLEKIFKEKTLHELMDKESEVVKQIRTLDSEMQTLVYENYNKFISATDTIKKMKSDFKRMEDEMNKLDSTLASVTEFSDKVNSALQDKRSHIAQLSGVHTLLLKLQFLFELPNRLNKCIEMKQYALAVRYYSKAQDVLNKYKHMPSFAGIHTDCEVIIQNLMKTLRSLLCNPDSTTRELTECVDLLLKLGEPNNILCDEFLTLARDKVGESLDSLRIKLTGDEEIERDDVLDFMDCGCNNFLGDISLVTASYHELFIKKYLNVSDLQNTAKEKLATFIMDHMAEFFKFVRKRLEREKQTNDSTVLVRALDKFYRKVQSVHQLIPESGMDRTAANIVAFSAHSLVAHCTEYCINQLLTIITDTRQALVTTKSNQSIIFDIFNQMFHTIEDLMKSVLLNLKAFVDPDIAFSTKPYFRGPFCIDDIREGLVVNFLKQLSERFDGFAHESSQNSSIPASLLLIMCKLSFVFMEKTIDQFLQNAESWFPVDDEIKQGCIITKTSTLQDMYKKTSHLLLNQYVSTQGLSISQMLRKSVETRDWLNTIEPRNVRAVMKRVVEDITIIDSQVGTLLAEGVRKAPSSDSSKRTHSILHTAQRNQMNYGKNLNIDTSLMSNIQKLFTERIEVFTAVDFNKISVLTGIIKIALKTLVECIRLRTFSKYGLQQIQVDTHYLQMYLWRFVHDENIVHFLLDEAINSAVHRCIEPEMMEPSVVEMICEKS
ncbi:vacuolar protein sorting-associated protein 51 homolog isoform X2 [Hydra vulgaris]|uniref:Vacuolar protein sorting-associated protein 51 homolog n=1 Tax=Hydra vulgaris TaxID=6087 RepID=A0ABM4BK25_HYDVU